MHPEFKDEDEAGERGENMVREMDVNSGEVAVVEMDNNRDTINKREVESTTWRYGNVEDGDGGQTKANKDPKMPTKG